ncbi:MAG TPA: response regulator transcription factor [Anaerolineae bacterium]|mgnify:CR=1 FL=1|nr:response regulator transcription factor [Anaerolineae bacterium]
MTQEIRLVLADDHAVVRSGTRELLEQQPDLIIVGEASDGEEAVRLAQELEPDVVIMDVRMPKLNGIEATRRIKSQKPGVRILVLTAHDDDEYVFALLQAGANGYLLKTAEIEELVRAIRTVASGQPALAPEVTGKVMAQFTSGRGLPEVVTDNHHDTYDGLTDRELGILRLVGKGMSNKQIGKELFISDRTVQAHLSNIFSKLGVNSRTEAVMHAVRRGWITTGQE